MSFSLPLLFTSCTVSGLKAEVDMRRKNFQNNYGCTKDPGKTVRM